MKKSERKVILCRTWEQIFAALRQARNIYDVRRRNPQTGELEQIKLPQRRSA